ncbi:MAG: pyruvate kinase [Candidatus Sericytochromatia bacterium]|nr:pyruvate kinase [Candidatus Sericytochromatia bacterium]
MLKVQTGPLSPDFLTGPRSGLKRAKIVATLGPASSAPDTIRKLILAGVDVFRLNFSHGTHADHEQRIHDIRAIAADMQRVVAILQDIQGPKIRIGKVEGGEVQLTPGTPFFLQSRERVADASGASVSYENLEKDVPAGAMVLMDDGLLELKVVEPTRDGLRCEVVVGGPLRPNKGVNFPAVMMDVDVLSEKDREDLVFGARHGVDFVAVSFVQTAEDVLKVRDFLSAQGSRAHVISKIERREAVERIADIAAVSDGVMVARGDLGVETAPEEVPMAQKRIISHCNRIGKPVITATQMLDSMIHNPRPTRAEASDVANAVLDGTDAVMLSNETAAGSYPLEAVETMVRIVRQAERASLAEKRDRDLAVGAPVVDAISLATAQLADKLGAASIITATASGSSARMVARYRPLAPILALAQDEEVCRKLVLTWGVFPRIAPHAFTDEELLHGAMAIAQAEGLVQDGELVVVTAGFPIGVPGNTNFIKVEMASTVIARGQGLGKQPVHGVARVVRSAQEADELMRPGDIMVTHETTKEHVPAMRKAAGVIVEMGGLTSHAAIVCLQLGIPLLLEVANWDALPNGEVVTMDPSRGVVYKGKART